MAIAFGIALLPLLYVASAGPAVWLVDQNWLSVEWLMRVYGPINWLAKAYRPFGRILSWYLDFWH